MTKLPLVTVVTPSLNQGQYIRQTIESVLSQDYPNVEYIIFDGGSTDETVAVVAEYAGRLIYVSETDTGQSNAINKGFRMAKGEIVAWLNSDDIFLPGAISAAVRGLQECPQAGAVYGEGFLMDKDGNFTCRFQHGQGFNLYRLMLLSDYILQQTVFMRKCVLDEVGLLREDLHYTMDWELFIRIGQRYPLHFLPHYMGALREYPDAKTSAGGEKRVAEIGRMLREKTKRRIPPGWPLYGLETLARHYLKLFEPLPGRLGEIAKLFVFLAWGFAIRLTVNWGQGWFHDFWATNYFQYWLPCGEGPLVLNGFLPNDSMLEGQRLRLIVNGRTVREIDLDAGPFTFPIQVSSKDQPVQLEIRASHFRSSIYSDGQHIAFRLYQIAWGGYCYWPPGYLAGYSLDD